jgi:hypothetical protein
VPTTSTSSSSTSSTTSSTIGAQCCNDATNLRFLTANAPGDCGDIITAGGAPTKNDLQCAGLYTGGGDNAVPLPFAVPDLGFAINAITSCTGQTATLGATTSTATGSIKSCTTTGCLFGAPLAVPNPISTPTSVCVTNAASAPLTGTAHCDTGATDVVLPLASNIFLAGDKLGLPGIQPCPICPDGSKICNGGPNNGMACTPGTTSINASYPTSHDCPPDQSNFIGSLPIAFKLTSGSLTWTGTIATNDSGNSASTQTRVFSGFCRDVALPGGTGSFDVNAAAGNQFRQCWENGMALGAPCSEAENSAESCEQRTQGAFGPNASNNRTITANGSASGILGGSGLATLVSIFSIPPTFDATIDGAGNLPGPGVVSLPGTATLCSNAMCD